MIKRLAGLASLFYFGEGLTGQTFNEWSLKE